MWRHEYRPPGWPEHYSFVIGWDDPLGTYFGLVIDAPPCREGSSIVLAAGGEPPHFLDLDNLMRVVNGRNRSRLSPSSLPAELRRELRKEAATDRPVVHEFTVTVEGVDTPAAASKQPGRSPAALGTTTGYLERHRLREVMDLMVGRYSRPERLYWVKKEGGLTEENDADTRLIRQSLGNISMICQVLDAMVHTDTLVAESALQPFYKLAADADRVLQAASTAAEVVH
jgi:hypothetical protein